MITIKEYTEQLETENRTLYEVKNYWKRLAEKRKSQLQQKENIIKEVRKKINNYTTRMEVLNYQISDLTKKELLEILDKTLD